MSFDSKDVELQRTILGALFERQTINANKDVGVAYLQAELEDRVNPSVIITRDDIRTGTGRAKVRDSVVLKYAEALQGPSLVVQQLDPDTLKLTVVPQRVRKNEFPSLKELQRENNTDLIEDPDLGEPTY